MFNIDETLSLLAVADYTISKAKSDLTKTYIEKQMVNEDLLEKKLNKLFLEAKKKMLKSFDLLTEAKKHTKEVDGMFDFLQTIRLEEKISYNEVGNYIFTKNTLPVQIKDYAETSKNITPPIIDIISEVDYNPFSDAIFNSTVKSHKDGGQTVFKTLNINFVFDILDDNVIKNLRKNAIKLSDAIITQISTQIKYQLIEGIKNNEGIAELRKRILKSWNKSIKVKVPPKKIDGKIVRNGYSYDLNPKTWATTVARTETAKAFNSGKVESWKQSGVVKKVIYITAEDEKTCPICAPLNGQEYSLKEAKDIIPQHANCRCSLIPILNDEFNVASSKSSSIINDLYSK